VTTTIKVYMSIMSMGARQSKMYNKR